MNNMKKFRKWLIHKLGGLCEDEIIKIPTALIPKEKQTQRIRAEFTTTFKNIPNEEIKRVLLDNIFRELYTYYFEIKKQELCLCDVYSMELEFVLQ